jgi:proteic killer suppression protein
MITLDVIHVSRHYVPMIVSFKCADTVALKGDRAGQHSIRGNDQYRVCFRWTSAGAHDVEIVDYH